MTACSVKRVIQVVEARLRRLDGEEQQEAARTFVLISGILGIEEEIGRRLKTDMIDIMENKVLGPAIRQGIEQGMRQALKVLVKSRFGSLPGWASARIDQSSQQEIQDLIAGASAAPTLEDLFR